MRKFLLFVFTAVFSAVNAFAQTELKVKFPMNEQKGVSAYDATWTGVDADGGTWTFVGFNNYNNDATWTYIKCGSKKKATTSEITTPVFDEAVSSISFEITKTSGVTSSKLEVLGADGSLISTKDVILAAGDVNVVLDGTKGAKYHLVIENEKVSSNGTTVLNSITVTKAASGNTAVKPALTKGGVFTTKPYDVVITNNEAGATVYYTLDGTDPSNASESFTGESKTVQISENTTVKAMAVVDGKENSDIASETYTYEVSIANTLETAYTTAEAIALIDAGSVQLEDTKVYVKGKVSKVQSFNNTYGSITYWLDEEDKFQVYGGLNNNGEPFASIDDIKLEAEVVVYGLLTKYNTTYEMNKDNWLVSYTAPAKPEPELTLSPYSVSLEIGDEEEVSYTYSGDGEVMVTSSDPEVATVKVVDVDVTVKALKAGKTTIKFAAAGTDKYLAKEISYTLTVTEKFVPAEVPFAFDGGVQDVTAGKGMTQTGLGKDYSASPHLKFDGSGDCLVIQMAGSAKYLRYAIKGNSISGETAKYEVMESADGETYSLLKAYDAESLKSELDETLNLKEETRFVKFFYTNKEAGNVGLGAIEISDAEGEATFDDEPLEAESVTQFAEADGMVDFNADSRYTFQNYCAYGGTYFAAFTLTNKTSKTANAGFDNPYESACGGAKSGSNYVVYNPPYGAVTAVTAPVARVVSGFYVTNTTYAENVILNGNDFARKLDQEGDVFTLKITGYAADDSETGSVSYNLAEVKEGKLYYVKDWRWVDLTSLGKVKYVKFEFEGSDTGEYGLNTPAYFAMDSFGGVAPETDAAMEEVDLTDTGIINVGGNAVENDGKYVENGRVVIVKAGKRYNVAGQMVK